MCAKATMLPMAVRLGDLPKGDERTGCKKTSCLSTFNTGGLKSHYTYGLVCEGARWEVLGGGGASGHIPPVGAQVGPWRGPGF